MKSATFSIRLPLFLDLYDGEVTVDGDGDPIAVCNGTPMVPDQSAAVYGWLCDHRDVNDVHAGEDFTIDGDEFIALVRYVVEACN